MTVELADADMKAVEREYCRRSLASFVLQAWHVLEPSTPYIHNWHMDVLCEHLEAVTAGQITRLLINVPPGTMKSLLTAVFWPAWEWGPIGLPQHRFVTASHSESYALRDARRMRQLITSDWFQGLWPLRLANDQNSAGKFENGSLGFRHAMPVRSMTGSRGDRVVWDDPHSVESAVSAAELATTRRIFHETLPTRLNVPAKSAIVIIMQRLAVGDVAGEALAPGMGYDHLMLPMEYEHSHPHLSTRYTDPRAEDGELLFPGRFPRHVVERDKTAMGDYAVAGQFQQRPAPRGGGMFPVDQFGIIDTLPEPKQIVKRVRSWDKAGTAQGGAYTAGVLMLRTRDGEYIIADVLRDQLSALKRERLLRQTAQIDGHGTHILIEQEPGSGGKESAESTVRSLAGYNIRSDTATGSKEVRADPYAAQVQAGNVYLLRADWNYLFKGEHETFPVGKYKDQVDAAAAAFNYIAPTAAALDTWARLGK